MLKKIFISSTFRDMNEERDLFHERICPALNAMAGEYGESVSFCDLRWGVDTSALESEDGSRKVLSVCLDEIDRCRPYMVVLLGERYGWIPSSELISETVSRRRDFALEELEKSVTALEIEYGALRGIGQLERTLFYFRQMEGMPPADYISESSHHREKLDVLKRRIAGMNGCHVKSYSVQWDAERGGIAGLDAFAEMVIADLRELMEREWQSLAALSPYQKDQHSQWEMAEQKGLQFTARYDLIGHYQELLQSDIPCFAVCGPSGSGKSTIMSRLALDEKARGRRVLPIFCGSSPLCSTAVGVLQYMTDYLETVLELPHVSVEGTEQQRERLDELVLQYGEGGREPLVILVDAVDQLLADEQRDGLLFLPSVFPSGVKAVISCLDSFRILRDISIETVPALDRQDRRAIVRGILAPTGRMLSDVVIEAIAAKDGGDKPLYLSLLVSRLEMMDRDDFEQINRQGGSIDAINQKQIEIIESCPMELDTLCVELLHIAAEKLGSELPYMAAQYLAMSRYGLRETDLEGIFRQLNQPWDALSFSRFRLYLNRFFFQREDGRWDFTHKSFRSGFLRAVQDPKQSHRIILEYMKSLPKTDEIRLREIMHHCVLADDKQYAAEYITAFCRDDDVDSEGYAGENVAALAQEDGGDWICDFLRDRSLVGIDHNHFAFLLLDAVGILTETRQNQAIKARFYQEFLCHEDLLLQTSRGRVMLDLTRYMLADTYMRMGGAENLQRAEVLMKKAMEHMQAEWEADDDETEKMRNDTRIFLLSLKVHLSNMYIRSGEKEKLETARELLFGALEEARRIQEESDPQILQDRFAAIYGSIADLYIRMKTEREQYHQEILSYNTMSCELYELDLQKEKMEESKQTSLLWRYNVQASILMEGTPEEREEAFAVAQRTIDLCEKWLKEKQSLPLMRTYGDMLQSMAELYQKQEDTESLRKAAALTERSISVREAVLRNGGENASMTDLAAWMYVAARIYAKIGDPESLQSAYRLYARGNEIVEQEADPKTQTKLLLTFGYMEFGEVLEKIPGQEEAALMYYRKAAALAETMSDMLEDQTVRYCLRESLNLHAELLEKLGRIEEALPVFLRHAEVNQRCLELLDSSNWAEILSNDLVHLSNLCMDVEGVWLETALECYLRRIQLHEAWSGRGADICGENELRVIYNNLAWLYENADGHKDPEAAMAYRLKCREKAEEICRNEKDDTSLRNLALASRKLAVTYKRWEKAEPEQLRAYLQQELLL